MAGITESGLTIKRLGEVISGLKSEAVPIFQDLVPPDEVVDTSDSSTIGRLIGLVSPSISDLWEAIQEVYWVFDPNSARGIALDNLVMYGGLTRIPPVATTADVVIWGDEGTYIPRTVSVVRSIDNNFYEITRDTLLSKDSCIGATLSLNQVTAGTTYSRRVTIGYIEVEAEEVATSGDTVTSILTKLKGKLDLYSSLLTTTLGASTLIVESNDILTPLAFTISNLVLLKVKARSEVRGQQVGRYSQEVGTINYIATPILGWDSVSNPFPALEGRWGETDEELRVRFRNSKFLRARNISDSLYSAVASIDGVQSVAIYENDTDTYDSQYDLPPHSFKVLVLGGDSKDVARAVWVNKPLGIAAIGNITEEIEDSEGFIQDISFSRPTLVNISIKIDISLTKNFPSGGVEEIKKALIAYSLDNIRVGGDVVYSRLYTPINSVAGHQVDSLQIGRGGGSLGTSNIVMDYDEMAVFNADNIVINIIE